MARQRNKRQTEIVFPLGHGGARRGAGRKPKGRGPEVAHRSRDGIDARTPQLVTVKLVKDVGNLRRAKKHQRIQRALRAAAGRFGTHFCQYSVQGDHLHLIVETTDAAALHKAMTGFTVRLARSLNQLLGRKGRVFADRFHHRPLCHPRQVRNALSYVLNNRARHVRKHATARASFIDPFSSAEFFDGWAADDRIWLPPPDSHDPPPPVSKARTWLLTLGWRKHRLLRTSEVPGPA